MSRIAILDDYQNVALQLADWGQLGGDAQVRVFNDHCRFGEPLITRLQPFDIICAMRERTPFPRQLLQRLPKLKLLLTAGMKNAAIDVKAANELGVTVCGTQSPGHATAEMTWGLMLALARNIAREDKNTRAGSWQTTLGVDLHAKTLGIVGLGRLGSRVARIANAFEMNVLAWSQNLSPDQARACGATPVSKEQLLSRSDFITLHVRLSARTTDLIGEREFALMKPDAYLINTSRGPIVNQDALITALQQQRIAGAGLDVYDIEPLPADHPLRALDNTVITPHLGFVTEETYRVFYRQMIEDIMAFQAGEPIRIVQ